MFTLANYHVTGDADLFYARCADFNVKDGDPDPRSCEIDGLGVRRTGNATYRMLFSTPLMTMERTPEGSVAEAVIYLVRLENAVRAEEARRLARPFVSRKRAASAPAGIS
ncbi:MAG: hypothetical protein HYW25_03960 [Candidatus Aenigmarchaeota archaeon]|nr:hypothetical protein [Candidatus Aenigmarchaeota archaeon]